MIYEAALTRANATQTSGIILTAKLSAGAASLAEAKGCSIPWLMQAREESVGALSLAQKDGKPDTALSLQNGHSLKGWQPVILDTSQSF